MSTLPENFSFSHGSPDFTIGLESESDGITESMDVILSVRLADYPEVEPFEHTFTLEYRVKADEVDEEESGFETDLEYPDLTPLLVNCVNETVYDLPMLLDAEGELRPTEVTFDNSTQQIAFFDKLSNKIFVRASLLTEENEGNHEALVTVRYGKGDFEKNVTRTLLITIDCLADTSIQDTKPETQTDETDSGPKPVYQIQPAAKKTPEGFVVPEDKIYDLSAYEVKESTVTG